MSAGDRGRRPASTTPPRAHPAASLFSPALHPAANLFSAALSPVVLLAWPAVALLAAALMITCRDA
jgi:hypothetical protein